MLAASVGTFHRFDHTENFPSAESMNLQIFSFFRTLKVPSLAKTAEGTEVSFSIPSAKTVKKFRTGKVISSLQGKFCLGAGILK